MGIIAVLVFALINCNYVLSLTIYNVTACRESSNLCAELHLDKCSNNSMMYLSEMKYGRKNEPDIISCNETEQACFKDGVGCCSNSGRDCFNNYTARNAYDIYKMCSGKSECVSRAAGHVVHCFDKYAWTTYSTIWHSCISVSDVIRFCDDAVTSTK
ncbi:hypothetical protein DPMN_092512 [Dreissena polymorpha]|uniref:Uncharacterized protein n=1 Tax=Dreissena polymorpha TaxID=45954 RepID=A0A9D4L429_DREPO|nr:hypothetical protein DPMN_092512 [Dreissena polymorpha]